MVGKYRKIALLRSIEIPTTPLLRPAFVRQSHLFSEVSDKMGYANSVDPDQTALGAG